MSGRQGPMPADIQELRRRAALRRPARNSVLAETDSPGIAANLASRLTSSTPASQLAALAIVEPATSSGKPEAGGQRSTATNRADAIEARLRLWGWTPREARQAAERIAGREADDQRRTCVECSHHRPGQCRNYRRALLGSQVVGNELARLAQHCPGFTELQSTAADHAH